MTRIAYEEVYHRSRASWRAWLEANHATSPGIWLVHERKIAGPDRLSYEEAVEEALCFGWIDSVGGKVDETRTRIMMTPRKPGSAWSTVNKERIERMVAAGLMTPAGQAKIDQAQRDGSWAIYDQLESLTVPDDLAAALSSDPTAAEGFNAFSPSRRKALLLWIATAKQPATRARRIVKILDGARSGTSPLDWPPNRDHQTQERPTM